MDDRIPARLAASFAASTGIERDELMQEARIACWRAETSEGYDPRKASLYTFASICATRHLCCVTRSHRSKYPQHQELSDELPDQAPSPEDTAIFLDLLRQLPDDARTIVDMMLGDAQALADATPRSVRRVVRDAMAWPADRANAAVDAILQMLRGPMVRRSPVRPVMR